MTTRELIDSYTREEGIALFNEKKTDKEVYDLFVSKGLTDSYETFIPEAQKVLAEKISKMSKEEILAQIEGAELTDEQLAQIAGGNKDYDSKTDKVLFYTGIAIGAVSIVTTASAIGLATGGCAAAAASAV